MVFLAVVRCLDTIIEICDFIRALQYAFKDSSFAVLLSYILYEYGKNDNKNSLKRVGFVEKRHGKKRHF